MKDVSIYALADPRTGRIRYVGQSRSPEKRLEQHRSRGGGGRARMAWINDLRAAGLSPVLSILATGPAENAAEEETRWIAKLFEEGEPLLNVAGCPLPYRTAIPDPAPEEIRVIIATSFHPETVWRLRELSAATDEAVSVIIRRAVKRYLRTVDERRSKP